MNGTNGHSNGTNGHSVHGNNGVDGKANGHSDGSKHSSPGGSPAPVANGEDEEAAMEVDEAEEDSTLLSVQPGFNRLLLVLRDERVMRFVKYVSAAAEGSRWDVCAEYEVGMVQEEGDE